MMRRMVDGFMRTALFFVLLIGTVVVPRSTASAASPSLRATPPRLFVLVVVDQLRADTLSRFHSRLLPAKSAAGTGGFAYLAERGAYYPLAEHETFQCMTGPGHAAILSGAHPYSHGIPLNHWWDQKTQTRAYCVDDLSVAPIGNEGGKKISGSSPRAFLGTTVSDEWKNAGLPGRVVSIALKDRSAVLMAGHRADAVLWHNPSTFRWSSSTRYFAGGALPEWVNQANEELAGEKGQKFEWKPETVASGRSDDTSTPDPKYLWGMESKFPYTFVKGERTSLSSPYGVEITGRLAERAIDKLRLGKNPKGTDFLLVSFSTHDYLAHGFGPNSRQVEEITVAEDRQIAKLLRKIERSVGLSETIVALTADHGGSHASEYLARAKLPGGRIDEDRLLSVLNERLGKRFGKPPTGQKWAPHAEDFAFYLNRPALDAKGKGARLEAEEILRDELSKTEGAAQIVTATDVALRRVPPGELGRKLLLTFFPDRSGDVTLIPRPGWVGARDYATHLTSYSYDRYVPLILTGRSFKPGRYAQTAKVIDLAPTLAFLLGIVPPSLSEGRVLSEALAPIATSPSGVKKVR